MRCIRIHEILSSREGSFPPFAAFAADFDFFQLPPSPPMTPLIAILWSNSSCELPRLKWPSWPKVKKRRCDTWPWTCWDEGVVLILKYCLTVHRLDMTFLHEHIVTLCCTQQISNEIAPQLTVLLLLLFQVNIYRVYFSICAVEGISSMSS